MRVRFWGEITRGIEKWVKLSLGHFLSYIKYRHRAPSTPKPGRMAQSLRLLLVFGLLEFRNLSANFNLASIHVDLGLRFISAVSELSER